MFVSILIFGRWWVTLAAQAHKLLGKERLFGFSTYLSTLENSPNQRAGLEWVCVSSLQRHCMAALLGDVEQGCPKATAETVSEFRLSASSA